MTIVRVDLSSITVPHMDEYTSGASNSFFVKFNFSEEWNDLTKLVTFKSADAVISQILDGDIIAIPHEVLIPNQKLWIGILGTRGETVVLPTVWKELRTVKYGVIPGVQPQDPTPSQYQQILNIAQSVRDDSTGGTKLAGLPDVTSADNGKILMVVNGAWALVNIPFSNGE